MKKNKEFNTYLHSLKNAAEGFDKAAKNSFEADNFWDAPYCRLALVNQLMIYKKVTGIDPEKDVSGNYRKAINASRSQNSTVESPLTRLLCLSGLLVNAYSRNVVDDLNNELREIRESGVEFGKATLLCHKFDISILKDIIINGIAEVNSKNNIESALDYTLKYFEEQLAGIN